MRSQSQARFSWLASLRLNFADCVKWIIPQYPKRVTYSLDMRGSQKTLHLVMRSHRRFAKLPIVDGTTRIDDGGGNMFEVLLGGTNVASMEIAWRNPKQVRQNPRRHSVERAGEHAVYILQEFVEDGRAGYWATLSGLEVVAGGRAA